MLSTYLDFIYILLRRFSCFVFHSFSGDGNYQDASSAAAHAQKMIEEGADIIDIGGESTRPGSEPVTPHEELDRVIPAIR
jgi:dihydropteroate synthase